MTTTMMMSRIIHVEERRRGVVRPKIQNTETQKQKRKSKKLQKITQKKEEKSKREIQDLGKEIRF